MLILNANNKAINTKLNWYIPTKAATLKVAVKNTLK